MAGYVVGQPVDGERVRGHVDDAHDTSSPVQLLAVGQAGSGTAAAVAQFYHAWVQSGHPQLSEWKKIVRLKA